MSGATRTLVTGRRVVTAPGEPPIEHGAVLIEGTTIVAVGPGGELAAGLGRDAVPLDLPGATVLPGLVNAHVHLAFDVGGDPVPALEHGDLDALERTVAANARAALAGGVTTVRDLGDRAGLVAGFRDRVATGDAVGPRILSAFAPLTPRGGHCWYLGGEIDTDGRGDADLDADLRRAVADRAAAGADVIKVMASGGVLTPSGLAMWESQFRGHELGVVVAAAREHGLPVAAHAHGTESMERCARAGVDTIEHASWRTAPTAGEERAYAVSGEVADRIATSGAAVVPTRARGWSTWPEDEGRDDVLAQLALADRHGIPTIAGNDAGVGPGFFDDLVDTLTLHAAAGRSHVAVLAEATTGAAAVLGLADRIGRLAPGYAADVLAVGGDPLADLAVLRDVRCVIAAGRPLDLV